MMNRYKKTDHRADWLRQFETHLLRLRPELQGKIDWPTANYLHNQGQPPYEAASLVASTAAKGEQQ
jgi:hypothetical protein